MLTIKNRLVIAALFVPMILALCKMPGALLFQAIIGGNHSLPRFINMNLQGWEWFVYELPISIVVTILFGLPLLILYRRRKWYRGWHYIAGGLIAGIIISFATYAARLLIGIFEAPYDLEFISLLGALWHGMFAYGHIIFGWFIGVFVSALFIWAVVVRPMHYNVND